MIALVLAAAVATSDSPLGAVDVAATAAKVQADIKRICPWVPIKVVECNNVLPCSKAELKRVMKLHQRCNDSLRRILACTASGVPADVCKQSI
ncbi:hypothetical protein CF121_05595 [Aeromonas media]|uniref:hypothetical protein n=1 Tax=Aeromonas media TaxID=651 RepID=UPI001116453D|nr:hypothetical protein [Aeromonas media]TNI63131.1 hypothetical protein CF121_05595 [Aeromonas media]